MPACYCSRWQASPGVIPSVDRHTRSLQCNDFLEGEHFTLSSGLTLLFLVSELLSLLISLFVHDVISVEPHEEADCFASSSGFPNVS